MYLNTVVDNFCLEFHVRIGWILGSQIFPSVNIVSSEDVDRMLQSIFQNVTHLKLLFNSNNTTMSHFDTDVML